GRRLLADIAVEGIADASEGEARPEEWSGIGHQRKARETIEDGLRQNRVRCRPQQVAAVMAERYHPRPEARGHGQSVGAVLEGDERPCLGGLSKMVPHLSPYPSGNRMVPSMTRLVSPAMTTVSPLSSHHISPPRGESWRLWILVLPIFRAQ